MEANEFIMSLIVTVVTAVYAQMKKVPIVGRILRFYETVFHLVTTPVSFVLHEANFVKNVIGTVPSSKAETRKVLIYLVVTLGSNVYAGTKRVPVIGSVLRMYVGLFHLMEETVSIILHGTEFATNALDNVQFAKMDPKKATIYLAVNLMMTVYAVTKTLPLVGTVLRIYERLFYLLVPPMASVYREAKAVTDATDDAPSSRMATKKIVVYLILILTINAYAAMKKLPIVGTVIRLYERLFYQICSLVISVCNGTKSLGNTVFYVCFGIPVDVASLVWYLLQRWVLNDVDALERPVGDRSAERNLRKLNAMIDVARRSPLTSHIVVLAENLTLPGTKTRHALDELKKYTAFTVQLVCSFTWLDPAAKCRVVMVALSYVLPRCLHRRLVRLTSEI